MLFFEETEDYIFYREQAVFLIFVSFFRCNFYFCCNPNLLVWVRSGGMACDPLPRGGPGCDRGRGTLPAKSCAHPARSVGAEGTMPPISPSTPALALVRQSPLCFSALAPWSVQADRPSAPRSPRHTWGTQGRVGPDLPPGTASGLTPTSPAQRPSPGLPRG